MRIAILGTGDVGQSLGTAFHTLGHQVRMGSRTAENEKAVAWASKCGDRAGCGTYAEVAAWAELVVLATLGTAIPEVIAAAQPSNLAGKILIDTTNPLDHSHGFPPRLASMPGGSAGETVQQLAPLVSVVKAFNTVGNRHMFRPDFPGGPPDMFICGDDEGAKGTVTTILEEFGWGTVDIGGIAGSGYLEAMCLVWVLYGARTNTWDHAFKLLRK